MSLALVLAGGCKGDDVTGDGDSEGDETAEGDGDGTGAEGEGDGDGDDDSFLPPPGGMRRMLDYQYINSIEYMFGPEAAAVANPPNDQALHGYTSIGANELSPGLDLVEIYEASALAVADAAIANPSTLAGLVPCVQSSPNQACYTEVAETLGHIAWRRPLTADEVSAVVAIANEGQSWGEGDFYAGLKYEIVRLLLSPDFIYVVETGVADPDRPDQRLLTGPEMVTRMSLLFVGRIPSLTLLTAAENGNYDDSGSLEALASAMLADVRAPDAISEFFAEYLALSDIPAKNTTQFPLYSEALVSSMVEETELLLRDVIWTQDTDFRTFFEADYTFVDANLAALYGIEAPAEPWAKVTLPPEQNRAGFISHASVLSRNSHGDGNSTTRRGQYIQQRMLCYSVPPPPPEVIPELPEVPEGVDMTLRELMELIHLEPESCASCHVHMDTLGFTLENYDALGAWRTQEPNGLPIDSAAEYEGFGMMENAADLAANVAMDPRTGRCIVNNIIRYGRGSLESPANDGDRLAALYGSFEASNFRFKQLLVDFVTSDLFRRVGAPK
ncbi:MAG: DUF1588 domain-containing protein [Enhygromyxa sp.]